MANVISSCSNGGTCENSCTQALPVFVGGASSDAPGGVEMARGNAQAGQRASSGASLDGGQSQALNTPPSTPNQGKLVMLGEDDIDESFSVEDIEVEKNYAFMEVNGKRIKKLVSCIDTKIMGHKAERISCRVLRKVLVKLGVKGYKGKPKKVWLELIGRSKHNAGVYADVQRE